jgi:hypothetical protein
MGDLAWLAPAPPLVGDAQAARRRVAARLAPDAEEAESW